MADVGRTLALLLTAVLTGAVAEGVAGVILGRLQGGRTGVEKEARDLVQAVVAREMRSCALVVLLDGSRAAPLLPPALRDHRHGVALVDLDGLDPKAALALKVTIPEDDVGVCRGVILLTRPGTWEGLLDADAGAWAGHTNTLVVLIPGEATPDVTQLLLRPDFRFSVQLVVASRDAEGYWQLHTTRLFYGGARQAARKVDSWTPARGFREGAPLFPRQKMADLHGYDFAVAALPYSPFIMTSDPSKPGPGRYRGLEVLLLDVLARAANFTYHYVAPEDNQWGRLKADGNWTGMIGMVVRERADWAVSDITFSAQREEYVDFCLPFIYDASELVTPLAKPLPQWLGPVRPFSGEVWAAIAVAVAAAGPFLSALARICVASRSARVRWFHNIGNTVLFTLQPVFQRGNVNDIMAAPGRVFVAFWLAFTMVVGIMYSSSLTSFLISPGMQTPIENLRQLVTSDIGWGKVYFGGVQSAILEQATDPVMVALREGVIWRDSLDGILQDVVKGTLATWDNSITTRLTIAVKYTDATGRPLVHLPGFEIMQERIAWPMQQYAPYKRRIDELISRVVQAGLVQQWLRLILFEEQVLARLKKGEAAAIESREEESEEPVDGATVLSLEHFQGPFFVLLLGYLAGALALPLEVLANHALRERRG